MKDAGMVVSMAISMVGKREVELVGMKVAWMAILKDDVPVELLAVWKVWYLAASMGTSEVVGLVVMKVENQVARLVVR